MKAGDRMVLDASVTVAWCFEDETTQDTERVLDALSSGVEAIVPAIWPFEVANALLAAERRGRLRVAEATRFLAMLSKLPITVEPATQKRNFDHVLPLSRQFGLTQYDASYLEVAIHYGLRIATLDGQLRDAAQVSGVALY